MRVTRAPVADCFVPDPIFLFTEGEADKSCREEFRERTCQRVQGARANPELDVTQAKQGPPQ